MDDLLHGLVERSQHGHSSMDLESLHAKQTAKESAAASTMHARLYSLIERGEDGRFGLAIERLHKCKSIVRCTTFRWIAMQALHACKAKGNKPQ